MKGRLRSYLAMLLTVVMLAGMLPVLPVSAHAADLPNVKYFKEPIWNEDSGLTIVWEYVNGGGSDVYFHVVVKEAEGSNYPYNNDGDLMKQTYTEHISLTIDADKFKRDTRYKIWVKAYKANGKMEDLEEDISNIVADGSTAYVDIPAESYLEFVDPENGEIEIGWEGEDRVEIRMDSSDDWTASEVENVGWIDITDSTGGPDKGQFFYFYVDENNGEEREAEIKIRMGSGIHAKEEYLYVLQEGKPDDDEGPRISLKSSAGKSFVVGTGTCIEAYATDDAMKTLTLYVDGQLVDEATTDDFTPDEEFYAEYTSSILSVGEHIVKAVAVDSVGNEAVETITIIVTSEPVEIYVNLLADGDSTWRKEIGLGQSITFTAESNADTLYLKVERFNESTNKGEIEASKMMTYENGRFVCTYTFSTAGEKYVWAETAGENDKIESKEFEIIVVETEEETISLNSDVDEVVEGGEVEFTAQSNSDSVELWIHDKALNKDYGPYDMTKSGNSFKYTHWFHEAGEKIVWAETADGTKSEEIEITVTEAEVQLATPVYTGDRTATVGERATFKWNAVENATGYTVWLYLSNDDADQINLSNDVNGTSVGYTFEEAGQFSIQIYAVGEAGYSTSAPCEVAIAVTAPPVDDSPSEPEIEKPDTPTANPVTAIAGKEAIISWSAVENATGYSVYVFWDDTLLADVSSLVNGASVKYTFMSAGSYSVQVRALSNAYNPSDICSIPVTVVEPERLKSPELSLSSTNLEVGEKLRVSWEAIENADYYTAIIWDMNREVSGGHQEVDYQDIREGTSYTSCELTYAGNNFMVAVYARSNNPDRYPQSADDNGVQFKVVEPAPEKLGTPIADNSNVTAEINTNVIFRWSDVENAEKYAVQVYDSLNQCIAEKTVNNPEIELAFDDAGAYWVDVYALAEGYEQSDKCAIAVTVVEPEVEVQQLEDPALEISSSELTVGEKLTVRWEEVENADYYTAIIWDMDQPTGSGHEEVYRKNITAGTSYTSPAMPYAGNNFCVAVYARSETPELYAQSAGQNGKFFKVVEPAIFEASIATFNVLDEDIATNTVTVSGQITFGTGETAASYDYVGIQYGIYQSEWAATIEADLNADGSFTAVVTGLNPETTYAFRAVAKNASTQKWLDNSNVVTATTKAVVEVAKPTVVTHSAAEITQTTAVLKGEVINSGDAGITEWGFVWKKDGDIDSTKKAFTGKLTETTVTHTLERLEPNSQYEYYFYAISEYGEGVGASQVFTTISDEEDKLPAIESVDYSPTEVLNGEKVTFTFEMVNGQQIDFYADVNGQMKKIMRLKATNDLTADWRLTNPAPNKFVWEYEFNSAGFARKVAFVPVCEYHDKNDNLAYRYGHMTPEYTINVKAYMNVPVDTVDVYPGGGDSSYTVDSNTNWIVSSENDWISVNRDGNKIFAIFKANPYSYERTGYITVSDPAGECASHTITAVQKPQTAATWSNVAMATNAKIGVSANGVLYSDITYTLQAKDASGNKVGAPITLDRNAKSWSISIGSKGLQLPRARTYSFEVIATNSNGSVFATYSVGSETLPLYNGSDIITVKDANGNKISSGAQIPYGETLTVRWDGSYGIHRTIVKVYITHEDGSRFKVIDHTTDTHGPGTFTIKPEDYGAVNDGRGDATYRAGSRAPISPQISIEVTPDIDVVPNANSSLWDKLKTSGRSTWQCSVSSVNTTTPTTTEYYIDYAINGIWQGNTDGKAEIRIAEDDTLIIRGGPEDLADDCYFSFINDVLFVPSGGGIVSVLGVGSNTIVMYKESLDEKDGTEVPIAHLTVKVYDPDYVYGWQLGYDPDHKYYESCVFMSNEVKSEWKNLNNEQKQLWFELNLGEYLPMPTLVFENYNDTTSWLWRQIEKGGRDIVITLADPLGNLNSIALIEGGLQDIAENGEYIITSFIDEDGLASSDVDAMADYIIGYWISLIRDKQIRVDGAETLVDRITYLENGWENASIEERYVEAERVVNAFGLAVNDFSIFAKIGLLEIPFVDEAATIHEIIVNFSVESYNRLLEGLYAISVIEALDSEYLVSKKGMSPELQKAVEKKLKEASNVFDLMIDISSAGFETIRDEGIEYISSKLLELVTVGVSSKIETSLAVILKPTAYRYAEMNSQVSLLEGSIEVYVASTKPNLQTALEVYRDNPTRANYQLVQDAAYAYETQSKAILQGYYTVLEMVEGKQEGAYKYTCKNEKEKVHDYVRTLK